MIKELNKDFTDTCEVILLRLRELRDISEQLLKAGQKQHKHNIALINGVIKIFEDRHGNN